MPSTEMAPSGSNLLSQPRITVTPITIEHVRITCVKSFFEVKTALEADILRLDTKIMDALVAGDHDTVQRQEQQGLKLSIFLVRDHGALLQFAGRKRNALQYEIGNPITASNMTRHELGAALYAPLRIALFETDQGEVVFEYDQPSTLFRQFHNASVEAVGLYLDRELEAALIKAAG